MTKPVYKLLLVEDDPDIAAIVRRYLEGEEFSLVWSRNAQAAAEAIAAQGPFDLALLDILLEGDSGLDVCARLRATSDCPIIFISCLDDSDTIVRALEMGGDDYIVKPFDARVLLARIRASLRRAGSFHRSGPLDGGYECAGFRLDSESRLVTRRDGAVSSLTPLEYQLLAFLIRNPGTFYPTKELYGNVWGRECYGDARTVIVLVHNLREKVEEDPSRPHYLVNARGRGYAFIPD